MTATRTGHAYSPLVGGGDNYLEGQVAEYCAEFLEWTAEHPNELGGDPDRC